MFIPMLSLKITGLRLLLIIGKNMIGPRSEQSFVVKKKQIDKFGGLVLYSSISFTRKEKTNTFHKMRLASVGVNQYVNKCQWKLSKLHAQRQKTAEKTSETHENNPNHRPMQWNKSILPDMNRFALNPKRFGLTFKILNQLFYSKKCSVSVGDPEICVPDPCANRKKNYKICASYFMS